MQEYIFFSGLVPVHRPPVLEPVEDVDAELVLVKLCCRSAQVARCASHRYTVAALHVGVKALDAEETVGAPNLPLPVPRLLKNILLLFSISLVLGISDGGCAHLKEAALSGHRVAKCLTALSYDIHLCKNPE